MTLKPGLLPLTLAVFALPAPLLAAKLVESAPTPAVPVTVKNFTRAESDMYFAKFVKDGGLGKFRHFRAPTSIDKQDVIRMNRDTLYSSGVFDLDAGPVTITLPHAGTRFMSLLVINEDHYNLPVVYAPGGYTFTREQVGTRYMTVALRTLVDPDNAADIKAANELQDKVEVKQASPGSFEVPNWDPVSLKKVRDALLTLAAMNGADGAARFGAKGEVDPIQHLLFTAAGWGGNPREAAVYSFGAPKANDGKTVHIMTVKDVPADGFWSISVYNAKGYFQKNALNSYSLNSFTAKPNDDSTYRVQFGGCAKDTPNCLLTPPGWNYTVRLYRPRKEIIDGNWSFPEPQPAN